MNRLKAERTIAQIRQADFAKNIGVNTRTVYRWEKGIIPIPNKRLCQLADFFGCTTDWLLGRSESRK